MLKIIAGIFAALTVIVMVAFVIAWGYMQEKQFDEINKDIEEIRKKHDS